MKSIIHTSVGILGILVSAEASREIILTASRDTFGRSNLRNKNNGGNEYLAVAEAPLIRSIIGFDLAGITNQITEARFEFRQHNTLEKPITLTVALMAQTRGNSMWQEGRGALGITGQNARIGDATFAWRAFRDKPWESENGDPLSMLGDNRLWPKTLAVFNALQWTEDNWIAVPIQDIKFLERVRESDSPIITAGLWGTAGKGFYFISAKESGHSAKLVLIVKDE